MPFGASSLGWRAYRVSFVGRHHHSASSGPSACVPIQPAASRAHQNAPVTLRPARPFPFTDCCHRSSLEAFVRIRTPQQPPAYHRTYPAARSGAGPGPSGPPPMWSLASAEMGKLAIARRAEQDRATLRAATPPPARTPQAQHPAHLPFPSKEFGYLSDYFDRDVGRRGTHAALADLALSTFPLYAAAAQVQTLAPPVPAPGGSAWPGPPRGMSPASHSSAQPSELFERVPGRHDTLDSASVYSAESVATSVPPVPGEKVGSKYQVYMEPESSASASVIAFPLGTHWDEVPVVEISFDLGALEDVPDPSGFFEERDVVVKCVRSFFARG